MTEAIFSKCWYGLATYNFSRFDRPLAIFKHMCATLKTRAFPATGKALNPA